jgi:hypothetical protein
MKRIILVLALFSHFFVGAQTTQADIFKARKEIQIKGRGVRLFGVDTTLSVVADTIVATQRAVKKYADSRLGGRPITGTPTTGQTIKWNGTNWVPSTDAGAWQYRTVTTTVGSANFTAFGSLTGISLDNMRVTRNGQLYKVGLSNCSDCQVSYNSGTQTFTLSRAVIAQETIQLQIIQ